MLSGKTKNKIYAAASIAVFISIMVSFMAVVNFLVKINNIAFSIDEKLIKEKTTALNMEGYERIKDKIEKQLD